MSEERVLIPTLQLIQLGLCDSSHYMGLLTSDSL